MVYFTNLSQNFKFHVDFRVITYGWNTNGAQTNEGHQLALFRSDHATYHVIGHVISQIIREIRISIVTHVKFL